MTILRKTLKTIVALGIGATLTVAGTGVASAAPAPAAPATANAAVAQAARPLALVPAAITAFQWVSGNQSWVAPNASRLARSVFVVDGGTFAMWQPDGYPALVGTIAADGTFYAATSSSSGFSGSTTVEILGQVGIAADGSTAMNITYVSGGTLAAVVNNTPFSSSRTKAYRASLVLQAA